MSATDQTINERLKVVRANLERARHDRNEADKEVEAAKAAWANTEVLDGHGKITDMPEFMAATNAVERLGEIKEAIIDLESQERSIRGLLGSDSSMGMVPTNGNGNGYAQRPWDGHGLLANADEFHQAKQMGVFTSNSRFGTINLGEIVTRDMFAAGLPPATVPNQVPIGTTPFTPGAIAPDVRGIIAPALKRISFIDLIPSGTTDSNIIQYVQLTSIPLSAAEVAELAAKQQDGLTAVDQTAPVRTIAAYIKMSRQSLDDVSGLGTLLGTLMPYNVRRRIELQMLVGNGTGQNLIGLMNTTGVANPAFVTNDTYADTILKNITAVVLSDGSPDFITMNPTDWQGLLLSKNSQGSYLYGMPGDVPNQMPGQSVWGLTVTTNRTVPVLSPLLGDSMGAQLLVREGINTKLSDADQDDFIKNRVTLLAECRVAFVVWRPTAFSICSLSATAGTEGSFADVMT